MDISLSPDQQQFIDEAISSGRYNSPSDLIAASLDRFQQEQQWIAYAQERIQAGLDDAEAGRVVDGEVFMAELQQTIERYRPLEKAS